MNTWIVKLGLNHFYKSDINNILEFISKSNFQSKPSLFDFKGDSIHYISFTTKSKSNNIKYHYKEHDTLLGFSGLIVPHQSPDDNFLKAGNLLPFSNDISEIINRAGGSFSIFKATNNTFECITDPLSTYKIFYSQGENKDIYVSNIAELIKLFIKSETNRLFFTQFIAAGGTYGNSTDDLNIFSLPESGRLRWDAGRGIQIDRYQSLNNIIESGEPYDKLISQTAAQLKTSARYLTKKHRPVVSLSGGFDSRLALNMFWDTDRNKVTTYTYPDIQIDMRLAKRVASELRISHKVITPSDTPDIETLHNFIIKKYTPFVDYNHVFGYVLNNEIRSVLNSDNSVLLTGLGGATHFGVTGFKKVFDYKQKEAIHNLLDSMIKKEYLTADGYHTIKSDMTNYYMEKYLPFLKQNTPGYLLANIHFFFERFGNYQSFKNHVNTLDINYFLPFGNMQFLKSVFASPEEKLYRHKKGGIHYELNSQLTDGKTSPIPFTKNIHWDANKFNRFVYRTEKFVHNKILKNFTANKKHSHKVRQSFFNQNLPYYTYIIHSHENSLLWNYFDRKFLMNLLVKEEDLFKNHSSYISKIVPLLKMGI